MVLLFTSNMNGGIVQFTMQILTTINKLGVEAHCYIPIGSEASIPNGLNEKVHYYSKYKSINSHDKRITDIAKEMLQAHPNIIWYVDSSILSLHLVQILKGRTKQLLTLHDAGTRHPTYQNGLRNLIQVKYSRILLRHGVANADNILVLSEESRKLYLQNYPNSKDKVKKMNLGAHIPAIPEEEPKELGGISAPYYLFFGRIDKYKGIKRMCEAYIDLPSDKKNLIIAGSGFFSPEENEMIKSDAGIKVINRYISDGEMIWLFKHAKAVVLPYIEATQSGIIPIAYKYGVPVITSDVPGLTQFVVNGETGFICKNKDDYIRAFEAIETDAEWISKKCINYGNKNFDWDKNVSDLLRSIGYGF